MLYGIDVIIVAPGAVVTPIWDKGENIELSAYENTDYGEAARRVQEIMVRDGRKGLPSHKVAEVVLRGFDPDFPRNLSKTLTVD